jgi:hypothetical protein
VPFSPFGITNPQSHQSITCDLQAFVHGERTASARVRLQGQAQLIMTPKIPSLDRIFRDESKRVDSRKGSRSKHLSVLCQFGL